MKSGIYIVVFLGFCLMVSACGSTPTPNVEATAQAALAATQVAQPTDTPVPPTDTPVPPTNTPTPTDTPVPSTDTPTPTATPVPSTDTPTPTNTPIPPTDTPTPTDTPAPPTDTPTPAPPPPTPTPAIEARFEQGVATFEQGQWDLAIAAFQEVVQLDPGFGVAYRYLGYSYNGKNDFEPAVSALEQYLQLVPDANDRGQVEDDLQFIRLAATIPPGKALFVFTNYTDVDWSIDVGPYHVDVPGWQGGEYPAGIIVLDPGTYAWKGSSHGGRYYITDAGRNTSFEFTVEAGEIYAEGVR